MSAAADPCRCRVCAGQLPEDRRALVQCRAEPSPVELSDMLGVFWRLGLHDARNRGVLLTLPAAYADLCDAWDVAQGRLAEKRRQREAQEELLRRAGLRR